MDEILRRRNLPPLNWLRAYEAAARLLSFSKASKELNVTSSAISQQVKLLESHIGTLLFQRLPQGLLLTDVGKAYLPTVMDALDRLASATGELFGDRQQSPITVRVHTSFCAMWLVPRLNKFRARHPNISLRLTTPPAPTGPLPVDIGGEGVDLEIRYGAGNWSGLECRRLTHEFLTPVCAPGFCLGKAGSESPKALLQQTLLSVIGYRDNWKEWFREAGMTGLDTAVGIQFDTSFLALEAARQGQGVALGRWPMIANDLLTNRLTRPFATALAIDEGYFIVWPKVKALNPKAVLLSDWLLEEAAAEPFPDQ